MENTKLIKCEGCDGFGFYKEGCGGHACSSTCAGAYCGTYRCPDCNGSGQVRQLVDADEARNAVVVA